MLPEAGTQPVEHAAVKPLEVSSLWQKVLHSTTANMYGVAASVVILFITARYLGPEGRGIYAAATNWVTLFATIGSLSLGQVIVHHAAGKQPADWIGDTLGTVGALTIALTLLLWLAALLAYISSDGAVFQNLSPAILLVTFAALPFIMASDSLRYVLYALDHVRAYSLTQIAAYTLSMAMIIALVVYGTAKLQGAALAWVALYLAITAGALAVLSRTVRPRFSMALARSLLSRSMLLHASTLATFVHLNSSVLILNHYRTPAETGIYQLAVQIITVVTILPMAFSSVAYTAVSQLGPLGAWRQQRQLLAYALGVIAILSVCVYLAAPFVVENLAGDAFAPAVPIIGVLLLALPGMTLAIIMGSQWIARGLFWQLAAIACGVAVMSLVLDFMLIPAHGMRGAVISKLVTYTIAAIINGGFAWSIERQWRRQPA